MLHAWSVHQSLSPSTSFSLLARVIQAGADDVYIGPDDSGEFYHYDGTALTSIGFETWANAQGGDWSNLSNHGVDATWFGGKLWIAANKDGNNLVGASIVSYNPVGGGFVHAKDFNVGDTNLYEHYYSRLGIGNLNAFIRADEGKLLTTIHEDIFGPGGFSVQFYDSVNGSAWTLTTIEAAAATPRIMLGSDGEIDTNILAISGDSGDATISRVIQSGILGWDDLTGQDLTNTWLIGHVDGKSWFQELDGATYEVVKSTDWGVNTSAGIGTTGVVANARYWRMRDTADGILGYVTVNRVFEYSPVSGAFVFSQELKIVDSPRGFIDAFELGGVPYILSYADLVWVGEVPELRLLGMASDDTYIYLTGNEGGTLKFWPYNLDTLIRGSAIDCGAATYAELDSRTFGIFPTMRIGRDIVYVRGCDGNDLQIQYSDDQGATLTDLSDAGWAVGKYAVGLGVDPMDPDDLLIFFADNDIYRSTDGGATWVKVDDAPVTLREVNRHLIDRANVLLAGQSAGAGQLFFSPNYGITAEDVSDAGLGLVNHIEASYE